MTATTSSAAPCTATAGCPGTIESDGYCNECGMAARPAAPGSAAPGSAAPGSAPPDSAPAQRPGTGSVPAASAAAGSLPTGSSRGPAGSAASSPSAATGMSATTHSGSTRTGSSRSSSRRRLGRGLVAVEPVTVADPAEIVQVDPKVPEDKRFCSNGHPVGRSRNGEPGRLSGFCPNCRARYSFIPKLRRGDLVGGQYLVAGCLAHGGLGWIYLATDRKVADRWVVLKGLLDTGDAAAAEAAVAERRFLAQVEQPNTVKIYNFVEHDGAGYIVMEYVGGKSLKDVLKARRTAAGHPDPLPVAVAIAFILDILPAFDYLHEHGLLYCDFKPDNIIQTADSVKLIDLGAVLRVDDADSAIYGTVGYQAPEVATDGPSVESDLYTVGRTLAALATDFRGYQSTFATSLPDPVGQPVFARYPSLYGLLSRACHPDVDRRFHAADEMAGQLLGVLREVLAIDGAPEPGPSALFTPERASALSDPDRRALPVPLVDTDDPNAAFLATVTVGDPAQLIALLDTAPADSPELGRRAVLALLDGPGGPAAAAARLSTLTAAWGPDWQAVWLSGLVALAQQRAAAAQDLFEQVRALLPGEPAPKLALGMCAERVGAAAEAARWYDLVSVTDPAFTSAAAGLARARAAAGDRAGAVSAFDRIPPTSAAWAASRVAAVQALIARRPDAAGQFQGAAWAGAAPPGAARPAPDPFVAVADLVRAAELIDGLRLAAAELAALRVELLTQALQAALAGNPLPAAVLGRAGVAGRPAGAGRPAPGGAGWNGTADVRRVRLALEGEYRTLARAADPADRIRLVDLANQVRPRTLI